MAIAFSKLKFLFSISLAIIIGGAIVHESITALSIKDYESVALDTDLLREDDNFILPEKIVIAPIFKSSSELNLRDDKLFRGLYYYFIQKLGFNDLPFHYVVTKSGNIYRANEGGDERAVSVGDLGTRLILVGYLTDPFETKIDPRSEQALVDLLTDVANRNGINPDSIKVSGISFNRNDETRSVTIEDSDVFGSWETSLASIKNQVQAGYNPASRDYNVDVVAVTAPTDPVEPGTTAEVTITLSNLGNVGLYGDSITQIVGTKTDGNSSSFFINGNWLSTTQFPILGDDESLRPFQESEFTVAFKAPLSTGSVTEEFDIRTTDGTRIGSGSFQVTIPLAATSRQIVEIGSTETGLLNVRSAPSSVASQVSQVSPGQRFFVVSDAGNGWIEIELDDGLTGWVAGWYLNNVN